MKRFALAALLVLFAVQSADACNRCGIYGRGCVYQSHVVSAPAYVAPYVVPTTVNLNLGTSFAQQGSTQFAYGNNGALSYNSFAQAYQVNPVEMIARVERAANNANALAGTMAGALVQQSGSAIEVARIQAVGQAAAAALHAAGGDQNAPVARSVTLRATIGSDGQVAVQQVESAPPQQAAAAEPIGAAARLGASAPLKPDSIFASRCAKCHSGATPKGGILLDGTGTLPGELLHAAWVAVHSDKMPKGGALTAEEKEQFDQELMLMPLGKGK